MSKLPAGTVKCPPCNGRGRLFENSSRPCNRCAGRGFISDERSGYPTCAFCQGTGKPFIHSARLCNVCDGWGKLPPQSVPPNGQRKRPVVSAAAINNKNPAASIESSIGSSGSTTFDRFIDRVKNHKVGVCILVLAAVAAWVATVTPLFEGAKQYFFPSIANKFESPDTMPSQSERNNVKNPLTSKPATLPELSTFSKEIAPDRQKGVVRECTAGEILDNLKKEHERMGYRSSEPVFDLYVHRHVPDSGWKVRVLKLPYQLITHWYLDAEELGTGALVHFRSESETCSQLRPGDMAVIWGTINGIDDSYTKIDVEGQAIELVAKVGSP